jgi:hypothetical protein
MKPEGSEIHLNKRMHQSSQVPILQKSLEVEPVSLYEYPIDVEPFAPVGMQPFEFKIILAGMKLEKSWIIRKKR